MARATSATPTKERSPRPARGGSSRDAGGGRPPAPSRSQGPEGSGSYLAGVVSELRKVTWPPFPELRRMTQVVIATVIIFAGLVGGLDFVLGLVAKPLYTQQGTAAPTSASLPVPTLVPTATPGESPPASPGATVSPGATPSGPASPGASPATSPAPSPASSPTP